MINQVGNKIVWVTKDNKVIPVEDMSPSHLSNSIKLLGRRIAHDELEPMQYSAFTTYLMCLTDELLRRSELSARTRKTKRSRHDKHC